MGIKYSCIWSDPLTPLKINFYTPKHTPPESRPLQHSHLLKVPLYSKLNPPIYFAFHELSRQKLSVFRSVEFTEIVSPGPFSLWFWLIPVQEIRVHNQGLGKMPQISPLWAASDTVERVYSSDLCSFF